MGTEKLSWCLYSIELIAFNLSRHEGMCPLYLSFGVSWRMNYFCQGGDRWWWRKLNAARRCMLMWSFVHNDVPRGSFWVRYMKYWVFQRSLHVFLCLYSHCVSILSPHFNFLFVIICCLDFVCCFFRLVPYFLVFTLFVSSVLCFLYGLIMIVYALSVGSCLVSNF